MEFCDSAPIAGYDFQMKPLATEQSSGHGWRTPALVLLAGCLIAMLGFGVRSSLGLFLEPMTVENNWSRESFGMALALQNLFWGIGLPIAGAMADKFGSARIIIFGAIIYALGLFGMTIAETPAALNLFAGLLSGVGVAFSAFTLALAAMVRVVGADKRALVLGLGTAAGSFGQVVFSPISQGFIQHSGWSATLTGLSLTVLFMIPLAFVLPVVINKQNSQSASHDTAEQTLKGAVGEAMAHRGFVLLTTGFFVCGFHVAFITVHFPAYVRDLGLDPKIGAYSLALIGLFNIIGSFGSGIVGQRFSMKLSLSVIYMARAVVILALLLAPKTPAVILLFASVMGILWLSTVPLTTGIIAQVFGVRYMATLFGIVFLSHQIGSFIGVWLGGVLFDRTGSYDGMWWAGVAFGVPAAIVHLPINERPVARLQVA